MGYYGSQHYASDYFKSWFFVTTDVSGYYGSQHYDSQHYATQYYGRGGGAAPPEPEPIPTGYSSPGLGGALFPKRKRPRIRKPEIRRVEREALPVEVVLIARPVPATVLDMEEPEAGALVPLKMVGGLWVDGRESRAVFVGGIWRQLEMRTSWQYEINGKWVNYDDEQH